jgi:hypothetical protein
MEKGIRSNLSPVALVLPPERPGVSVRRIGDLSLIVID